MAAKETFSIFRMWFVTRTKSKYDGTTIIVFELATADFIKAGSVYDKKLVNVRRVIDL